VVCSMRSAVSPDPLRRSAGVAVVNMPVASGMTCLDCLGAFGLREETYSPRGTPPRIAGSLNRKVLGCRGRTLVWQERRTLVGPSKNVRDSQVWLTCRYAYDPRRALRQVVDLMLQDSGIPANCLDPLAFRMFIQVFHGAPSRPRHNRRISRHTQTALKEFESCVVRRNNPRINYDVKWNRLPLPLGQLRRTQVAARRRRTRSDVRQLVAEFVSSGYIWIR